MEYSRRDTCYGTVWCRNSKGVYLRLDNGQTAFAYGFLDLKNVAAYAAAYAVRQTVTGAWR